MTWEINDMTNPKNAAPERLKLNKGYSVERRASGYFLYVEGMGIAQFFDKSGVEAKEFAAAILAKHRQPVAPSRTAEEVADAIVSMQQKRNDIERNFSGKELKFIDTKLLVVGIECARLALEAAANKVKEITAKAGGYPTPDDIRALDPAAIVKGDA